MRTTHVRAHTRQVTLSAVDARLKRLEKRLPTIPPLPLGEANDLPVQVSIIVPSTKNNNQPIDEPGTDTNFQNRVTQEKNYFDDLIGGDTTIQEVGSYLLDGEVIKEPGAIVQVSMTRADYNKFKNKIAAHAIQRKNDWQQNQIAVIVEGRTYFAPKDKNIPDDTKMPKRILVN